MKIRKIVATILIFIPLTLFSQTKPPVKIEADHLRYSGDARVSMFEGNVVAVYEDATIYSDTMNVYLNNDKKVERVESKGNVKILRDNMTSLAEYAELDVNSDKIVLRGDVRVWQDQNYMEGEEVFIYTKDNRVVVNKGKSSRVKIIFYPEEDTSTDNKTIEDNLSESDNKTINQIDSDNGAKEN